MTQKPKPNGASRLTNIKKGQLKTGHRFIFYGIEAVGKSTLAAHAERPIFLDCEDGSARLDVARYPFRDGRGGHVARSYEEVFGAIEDLAAHDHGYKTVVIDTMDRLEAMIWDYVMARDKVSEKGKKLRCIDDYGWGKGYTTALAELRRFVNELESLRRETEMDIILLGHAQIRKFQNPDGDDWDRYGLRLQHSEKISAANFMKEWADVVGFCRFEEVASKMDPDQHKAKGYSTGRRVIHFERTHAFDAKSRIPLPKKVEIEIGNPWRVLGEAISLGEMLDSKALLKLIGAELKRIDDDELTTKVRGACKGAEDVGTLSRYLNNLKERTTPTQENANV